MTDLIARLEAAGEGSRELDYKIARKFYRELGKCGVTGSRSGHYYWLVASGDDLTAGEAIPHYTRSLDAALPWEGDGFWEISGPRQYLNIPSSVPNYWYAEFTFGDRPPYKTVKAWAATEPLVRRIAALKAREKANG